MEILELLEEAALFVSLAVAVYVIVGFRRRWKLGLLMAATILLIAGYNVMPLGGEEGFSSWVRHVPVYIGMFGLSLFFQLFAKAGASPAARGAQKAATAFAGVIAAAEVADGMSNGTLTGWLQLLTDEGLQHIVVLPLFVAVIIATVVRSADAPESLRKPLKYFLFAGTAGTLIHVMEFIIESQGMVPALEGAGVETLELILVYTMLAWFTVGIRSARTSALA